MVAQDTGATRRPWVLPDEPVAVRLMNTIYADRTGVHDALGTAADLAAWLGDTGLLDRRRRVTREDLARARSLRDALRRLAGAVTAGGRATSGSAIDRIDDAVAVVNAAAAAAPDAPRVRLVDGRLQRHPAALGPPVISALSRVAAEAVELLTDPGAAPLGACHGPGCVLFFVKDHPRREWCSSACGNRARVARHYRRHRAGAAEGASGSSGSA
jgi:predicted RNA-binding Zn ribbon-like protein